MGDNIDRGRTIDMFDGNGFKKHIQVFTFLIYKKMKKSCQRNPLVVSLNSRAMVDFAKVKESILNFLVSSIENSTIK